MSKLAIPLGVGALAVGAGVAVYFIVKGGGGGGDNGGNGGNGGDDIEVNDAVLWTAVKCDKPLNLGCFPQAKCEKVIYLGAVDSKDGDSCQIQWTKMYSYGYRALDDGTYVPSLNFWPKAYHDANWGAQWMGTPTSSPLNAFLYPCAVPSSTQLVKDLALAKELNEGSYVMWRSPNFTPDTFYGIDFFLYDALTTVAVAANHLIWWGLVVKMKDEKALIYWMEARAYDKKEEKEYTYHSGTRGHLPLLRHPDESWNISVFGNIVTEKDPSWHVGTEAYRPNVWMNVKNLVVAFV